jgi:hypothetical protein
MPGGNGRGGRPHNLRLRDRALGRSPLAGPARDFRPKTGGVAGALGVNGGAAEVAGTFCGALHAR